MPILFLVPYPVFAKENTNPDEENKNTLVLPFTGKEVNLVELDEVVRLNRAQLIQYIRDQDIEVVWLNSPGVKRKNLKSLNPNITETDLNRFQNWMNLYIKSARRPRGSRVAGVAKLLYKHAMVKEHGQWKYIDGELFEAEPVPLKMPGRNEPCFCGSGKKFKKCCGKNP